MIYKQLIKVNDLKYSKKEMEILEEKERIQKEQ